MTSPSSVPDSGGALAAIAQRYFDALADGDFARVPWSSDVVLRTPLQPTRCLEGRRAVEAFFRAMAGQLGPIRLVETYVNPGGDTLIAEAHVGPLHVFDKFVVRAGRIVEQENVFDPRPILDTPAPGAMSADERALLVELLEATRDRFRLAVQGAPEELWRRKPAGGGWSAAECAEHLVLAEEALLGLIREKILTAPANPSVGVELRGKDGVVVEAMHNRAVKAKTLEFLEPQGNWPNQRAALDAFLARRANTLEYARRCREPLHHHAAPLGDLGSLDAYQWLLLLASHSDRHVAQMQEALRGA
jgi:hypothetical protein